jgi:ribosomal protein S18 acetylase RimI-like enzyme
MPWSNAMRFTVKQARGEDVAVLSTIARLTFSLAGPANSSKIEIEKYIAKNLNESVFQKYVESADVFVACAQTDSELVGFIVVKYCSSCPCELGFENSAELQRLYVLPDYHGTNSSKLLVSEAFKECSAKGIDAIWLSVYSENSRAKKFYSKFGFQEIGKTHFKMGNEKHLDTILVANLVAKERKSG